MDSRKLMDMQTQIKNNTTDMHNYFSDLSSWTDSVNKKEKSGVSTKGTQPKKTAASVIQTQNLPPIRNKVEKVQYDPNAAKKSQDPNNMEKFRRDNTPLPDYYKAWDKLATDIDDNENTDKNQAKNPTFQDQEPATQADMMKLTSGAKPNTQMVVKGGTQRLDSDAEEFKKQGNSYFVSLEYRKAIEMYTKCLRAITDEDPKDMRMIIHSNRSQSHLKIKQYEEAEKDADAALKQDDQHLKSLTRRAQARFYLKKYKQAQGDMLQIDRREPTKINTDLLKKTSEKLSDIKQEAYEKMRRRVRFTDFRDEDEIYEINEEARKVIVPVVEMHVDTEQVEQMSVKKEEVVQRQNKKNKNKKKKKGLNAFLEDDTEAQEFQKERN